LTERVIAGKRAGQSVADLQRTITAASLKSLRSGDFVPADAPEAVGTGIKESIDNMYERADRAYVMQGDTAKAKAAYQDFLTLWKDADPDIPILKQAKAQYARLQ